MIKIYNNDKDIIFVSNKFLEISIKKYLLANFPNINISNIFINTNYHEHILNYSTTIILNGILKDFEFNKIFQINEITKMYVLLNFNINTIISIGINNETMGKKNNYIK
ncbi:MAG: hypothetical protein ACRCW6_00445 [Mycoplasmoidaceae bacterium]